MSSRRAIRPVINSNGELRRSGTHSPGKGPPKVLTIQPAKSLRGKIDLPPSSDLFVLTTVVALARRRTIRITAPVDTPFLRDWQRTLEGHAVFEWSEEGCLVSPVMKSPSLRVGFDSTDIPWRDLTVFTLLGMGKTLVFRSITEKRLLNWREQAKRLGQVLVSQPYETSLCLSIEGVSVPNAPDNPATVSPEDIHPLLGLLLGSGQEGTFQTDTALSSPLRSVAAPFGCVMEVKSSVTRERDEVARRLQIMQQKGRRQGTASGQRFIVTADFTRSEGPGPEQPLTITLPGDEIIGAALTAAKCLFPKSQLVISNILLETWATPLIGFIRKMGCKVSAQETVRTSFGSCGMLHIQTGGLEGRKVECVPAVEFSPYLAAMVVVASFAQGESVFRGLEDLRHDEPDGIELMESCIRTLGPRHGEMPDGIVLKGGRDFDGFDMASPLMAAHAASFAVAALRCIGTSTVNDEALMRRFPYFESMLNDICERRQ